MIPMTLEGYRYYVIINKCHSSPSKLTQHLHLLIALEVKCGKLDILPGEEVHIGHVLPDRGFEDLDAGLVWGAFLQDVVVRRIDAPAQVKLRPIRQLFR